ncbi:hypothetical protein KO02_22445 [Sphingobacterium sp. ML3W]|uniref:hypothetical protein n=1 Tax=Sphingobacterium sp. ML3W TaxID=1538644 RepID=UPI0004F7730D|nr:hypothetical protein [Sphingobacterium sp. ML3W]AIM39131.1 hypothetical protein KO02_22445 [Sphingobacterium sp. ML3W]
MNQSQKMLLLQFSEVEELISKTRGDTYSDNNKAIYHDNLIKLFDGIKAQDLSALSEDEIKEVRSYIKFIFNCLVFLRDSTLNSIPFEIVRCLNNAMEDWVKIGDFIIVTGLTKDLYAFSFFLDYTRNDVFYQSIKIKFGVEFKQKLVQINLPITLCKDYISTVPLYHELGHFIEKQFDVAKYAIYQLLQIPDLHKQQDILKYFPFIDQPMIVNNKLVDKNRADVFYTHLMEYFCDLFASQYIGMTSNLYLNSISYNNGWSTSHPATPHRERMVRDFVDGNNNLIINTFNEILNRLTGKTLMKRFSNIESDDFYNLIPVEAKSDAELHGIFEYGWNIWLADFNRFDPMLGTTNKVPGGKIYSIINSLMEKSIGNYFITKEWNNKK